MRRRLAVLALIVTVAALPPASARADVETGEEPPVRALYFGGLLGYSRLQSDAVDNNGTTGGVLFSFFFSEFFMEPVLGFHFGARIQLDVTRFSFPVPAGDAEIDVVAPLVSWEAEYLGLARYRLYPNFFVGGGRQHQEYEDTGGAEVKEGAGAFLLGAGTRVALYQHTYAGVSISWMRAFGDIDDDQIRVQAELGVAF